jgi:O-antigen/teichoic acid export membrane protein
MAASLTARTALGILSMASIVVIALLSHKHIEVKLLMILLGLAMLITNMLGSFTSVLVGLERFKAYGLISATYSFTYSALAIAALYLGFGLVGIGVSQLIVAAAITLLGIFFVSMKVMKPAGGLSIAGGIGLLKMSAPLGLAGILVILYYRIGFVLLSFIKGDIELGYYNSAFTIVNGLLLFAGTFSGTLLPRLSSLYAEDEENLGKLFRTAFKYLFILGIGFAFGAAVLAGPIFDLLFGPEYHPGASSLAILGWATVLMFINSLHNNTLVALNMKKKLLLINGVVAAANILLNIALIPRFGFRGAAGAVLGSELILSIWTYSILRVHNPGSNLIPLAIKTLAAALAMTFVVNLIHAHVVIRVALGIAVYALALVAVKGLDRSDLQIASRIIKRSATDFETAT